MALLFRLPLMLLELFLRWAFDRRGDSATATVVTPEPPAPASPAPAYTAQPGPPPPTADEALSRRADREATAARASATPLRPISEAQAGHVDTEATIVESFGPADDVNGSVTVDEPWAGYDGANATTITQRLRDADAATKAVVALYERSHKNRATVLKAAR